MKRVAIDKLLQWTLNDELPKGYHVFQNVVRIVERVAAEERASRKRYIPPELHVQLDKLNGCYLPGEPHPDAIAIGKKILRFGRHYSLTKKTASALLGQLAQLDPQSITAACGVRPDIAGLIYSCAILKRPPILRLDHPRPRPVFRGGDRRRIEARCRDAEGKLIPANVTHWSPKRPSSFYGEPRCPLSWEDPTIQTVAKQRAEYTIWWRALALLQRQLSGLLRDHEALPPGVPAEPWAAGAAPTRTPRILTPLVSESGAKSDWAQPTA